MKRQSRNKGQLPAQEQRSVAEQAPGSDQSHDSAVRLHSAVEIFDTQTKTTQKIKIVMPDAVDLKKGCVSVFAPLSVALLGSCEGDLVKMLTNGSGREFRVLQVINPKT